MARVLVGSVEGYETLVDALEVTVHNPVVSSERDIMDELFEDLF